MSFEDAIKASMASLLQSYGIDAVRVNSYEEEERMDGFCDTCYYEWTVVVINYIDSKGVIADYNFRGDFGDLINELTAY